MSLIRPCEERDLAAMAAIINAAAQAYRGVIPPDRWHEPYMPMAELQHEIAAGVVFRGFAADGRLLGVMGIQTVRDVDLIRHAYVLPDQQRRGIGAALIEDLLGRGKRRMLVGTWTAASWAIGFYRHHGFVQVETAEAAKLLRAYWSIPERQIETSVVLSRG